MAWWSVHIATVTDLFKYQNVKSAQAAEALGLLERERHKRRKEEFSKKGTDAGN